MNREGPQIRGWRHWTLKADRDRALSDLQIAISLLIADEGVEVR